VSSSSSSGFSSSTSYDGPCPPSYVFSFVSNKCVRKFPFTSIQMTDKVHRHMPKR
jgi:hypothetical protein